MTQVVRVDLSASFLNFALLGSSWVLWVLVGLSVLSVTVAFQLVLRLRRAGTSQRGLRIAATRLWAGAQSGNASEELEELRRRAQMGTGPTAVLLRGTLESADANADPDAAAAVHEAYRNEQRVELERHVGILGTVGANAPFIGLFGTVLEILRVFHDIGVEGMTSAGSAPAVMSGISEALVATGVGLLVAIPAVIAYNALLAWADSILGTAQEACQLVQAGIRTREV